MTHQARSGLDQAFAQGGQRPALDRFGRRRCPQEVGQIVGQSVKLEPHGISREPHTRQPRPFERVFALLDVLLSGAPPVVEGQHPFIR